MVPFLKILRARPKWGGLKEEGQSTEAKRAFAAATLRPATWRSPDAPPGTELDKSRAERADVAMAKSTWTLTLSGRRIPP